MDLMKWLGDTPIGIDGKPLLSDRIHTLGVILQDKFGKDAAIGQVNRLKSRKNIVLHLRIVSREHEPVGVVAKMFVAGLYDTELSVLNNSWKQGLVVPEVIEAQNGVILMSFISGETLVDIINATFDPHLIDLLAQWYYNYHSVHRQIKGDPRLRNFIYHENVLYGVDFEESCSGPWMLDIAGISASLLDTNPIFDSRKKKLSWHLLDSYLSLLGQERDAKIETEFTKTIADALKLTSIWRKDTRILELSETIRTKGLPEG
jgi:tRNA A-37 threonylcarbamoyl transferase component Bud32